MRSRSTIEFIGLWELFHNPDFKGIEFDGFKNEAGSNSFTLTPNQFPGWIADLKRGKLSEDKTHGVFDYEVNVCP